MKILLNNFLENAKKHYSSFTSWLFIILLNLALISCFLIPSITPNAYLETLSSLVNETALESTSNKILNVSYTYVNEDANRALLTDAFSQANADTVYKNTNSGYNARVIYDANNAWNYSFPSFNNERRTLLISGVFSNHLNPNGETIHDVFEFKLMFPDANTSYTGFNNFCYIRQDDADTLITNSNGFYQTYEDLLGEELLVTYTSPNGTQEVVRWKIANVLCSDNDFYHYMDEIIAPFVLCYTNLPSFYGFSYNFDYGTSIYTTMSYLQSQMSRFGDGNYAFSIVQNNVLDNEISKDRVDEILSYYSPEPTTYPLSNEVGIILSLCCYMPSLLVVLYQRFKEKKNIFPFCYIDLTISAFFVYTIFWGICGNNAFLTPFFLTNSSLFFLISIILIFVYLAVISTGTTKEGK